MSWLSNGKEKHLPPDVSFLAPSVTIEGHIEALSDLRIEGKFEGTIHSQRRLIIGEKAEVKGTFYAQELIVAGHLVGKIFVQELLVLRESAHVEGEIFAKKIEVSAGAQIRAHCHTGETPELPPLPKSHVSHAKANKTP
ncbi:MAG: bactofilin family protein [Bacteroidia bacterium]